MSKGKKYKKLETKSTFTRFSVKSAFIILFGILFVTLVPPVVFDALHIGLYPLRVAIIALGTAFVFCYCLYFVDSNKGLTKGFWITFVLIALLTGFISYFWVYDIYYI